MLTPLFTTLRSQPLSRTLRDSRALWATLDAFDAITDDFARPYPGARIEADETDTAYTFTLALPGFKKEDVQIEVTESSEFALLHVSASRGGGKVVGDETKTGQTTARHVTLPSDADPAKVEAKMEDGLLSIVVQKLAQPAPRKVTVS